RDPSGKVLRRLKREPTGTWTWVEDYVYMNGRLVASEVAAPERTLHFHQDHLGTPRLITNHMGARVALHTYHAFGRQFPVGNVPPTAADTEPLKFTGHERDSPELDYMHARYYLPSWGRFLSVDPLLGTPERPQSWNRNSYVQNNPVTATDLTGMATDCVWTEDGTLHCTVTHDENSPPAPPLPEPPPSIIGGLFPDADRWLVDNFIRPTDHGYARLANAMMFTGVSVEECYAARLCQTLSEATEMFGPMMGGQYNPAKAAMLGKKADDLIRGSLKASASYRAELGQMTYAEIIKLSHGAGPLAQAAKQMKKLIEQSKRLLAQVRGK
ncbi:MAG TPA: RHS repeat-associated core domain-containing protein, partial [Thermoanaerobaculia bacterium]